LLNQDFKDLLSAFNDAGVDFLVVGAHALAAHGHIRATKDLDVWVRPDLANAHRVMLALDAFGAPTHALRANEFATPGITFQIGVEPVRIDIITDIDGVSFETAWPNRVSADYGDVKVFILSREDFITNKRASGRPQDIADIAALEQRK
jgi:hypothetical protein